MTYLQFIQEIESRLTFVPGGQDWLKSQYPDLPKWMLEIPEKFPLVPKIEMPFISTEGLRLKVRCSVFVDRKFTTLEFCALLPRKVFRRLEFMKWEEKGFKVWAEFDKYIGTFRGRQLNELELTPWFKQTQEEVFQQCQSRPVL